MKLSDAVPPRLSEEAVAEYVELVVGVVIVTVGGVLSAGFMAA